MSRAGRHIGFFRRVVSMIIPDWAQNAFAAYTPFGDSEDNFEFRTGTAVQTLFDRSGNGNNLTQTVQDDELNYDSTEFGNVGSIESTKDSVKASSKAAFNFLHDNTTDYSVGVVFKMATDSNGLDYILRTNSDPAKQGLSVSVDQNSAISSNAMTLAVNEGTNSTVYISTDNEVSEFNELNLMWLSFESSTKTMTMYVLRSDGTICKYQDVGGVFAISDSDTVLELFGQWATSGTNHFGDAVFYKETFTESEIFDKMKFHFERFGGTFDEWHSEGFSYDHWYRATGAKAYAFDFSSGVLVSKMEDLGTGGKDMSQSVVSNQMTYEIKGGLPVVSVKATGDTIAASNASDWDFLTEDNDYVLYLKFYPEGLGALGYGDIIRSFTSGNAGIRLMIWSDPWTSPPVPNRCYFVAYNGSGVAYSVIDLIDKIENNEFNKVAIKYESGVGFKLWLKNSAGLFTGTHPGLGGNYSAGQPLEIGITPNNYKQGLNDLRIKKALVTDETIEANLDRM